MRTGVYRPARICHLISVATMRWIPRKYEEHEEGEEPFFCPELHVSDWC